MSHWLAHTLHDLDDDDATLPASLRAAAATAAAAPAVRACVHRRGARIALAIGGGDASGAFHRGALRWLRGHLLARAGRATFDLVTAGPEDSAIDDALALGADAVVAVVAADAPPALARRARPVVEVRATVAAPVASADGPALRIDEDHGWMRAADVLDHDGARRALTTTDDITELRRRGLQLERLLAALIAGAGDAATRLERAEAALAVIRALKLELARAVEARRGHGLAVPDDVHGAARRWEDPAMIERTGVADPAAAITAGGLALAAAPRGRRHDSSVASSSRTGRVARSKPSAAPTRSCAR